MVITKRKVSINRIPLPYTPEDAERIILTGQLDHVPKFSKPGNGTGFYMNNLCMNQILSWPPELPDRDPRGHLSCPNFVPWKKARDSKFGIAGNYPSFKAAGLVPCHSTLEKRYLYCFEMNPLVVEIRAQYPMWDRSVYRAHAELGLRMPKQRIMTIDFVLTLKLPGEQSLRYHAVSIKPHAELLLPAVKRRHKREADRSAESEYTHEIMTEHSLSYIHAGNCRRLFECMRYVDDISSYRNSAMELARDLFQQRMLGTCDQRIERVSCKHGWSLHEGYRIFAIANFLGYLSLDHRFKFLPDRPLMLEAEILSN